MIYELDLEHVDEFDADELTQAAAIVALLQLKRRKLYDDETQKQLHAFQRTLEAELGRYGLAMEAGVDTDAEWAPALKAE